jgi:hypothetical protein
MPIQASELWNELGDGEEEPENAPLKCPFTVVNIERNLKAYFRLVTCHVPPTITRWRDRIISGEVLAVPRDWFTKLAPSIRKQVLKACHYDFFCNRTANRNVLSKGLPPLVSHFCPLCESGEDGWAHTLLHCAHSVIACMISARHQKAVAVLFRAMMRRLSSNCLLLADLSEESLAQGIGWDSMFDSDEDEEDEDPLELEDTDILNMDPVMREDETADPSYVPPPDEYLSAFSGAPPGENERELDSHKGISMRRHLRTVLGLSASAVRRDVPDLVKIAGWSSVTRIPESQRSECTVTLVEFTFTADNKVAAENARSRKETAYAPLCTAIERLGFPRPTVVIIVAGVRGWHPRYSAAQVTAREALRDILSPVDAKAVTKQWTFIAWHAVSQIIRTRRRYEFQEPACERSGLVKWMKFKADGIVRKRKSGR